MCCRFYIEETIELQSEMETANRSPLLDKMSSVLGKPLKMRGEIFPTDILPVFASSRLRQPTVFPMCWGFHLPHSRSPLINARVETAWEKPLFQESWLRHRCAIPISCYFEWEHPVHPATGKTRTGMKYRIQPVGHSVSFLAGLYRIEELSGMEIPVFTVLTREPSAEIRTIHDRMPVILPKASVREWIHPDSCPEKIVQSALLEMTLAEDCTG